MAGELSKLRANAQKSSIDERRVRSAPTAAGMLPSAGFHPIEDPDSGETPPANFNARGARETFTSLAILIGETNLSDGQQRAWRLHVHVYIPRMETKKADNIPVILQKASLLWLIGVVESRCIMMSSTSFKFTRFI